jgi:membrane-associated phospholipid phosphatase
MDIKNIDHILFHLINQGCINPVLDSLCPLARDKNTWMPFYIMGGLLVLYKYRWQGLLMLVFAGLSVLISDQSSNVIKHFIHRLRPCAADQPVRLLVAHCSDTYSFTSNHAANHFSIAVFLLLVFRRFRSLAVALLLWASFISFSQVYVGLHYPADIVGGAILGALVGWIVFLIFKWSSVKIGFESLTTFR